MAPDSKCILITAPEKSKTPIYEVDVTTGNARLVWNEASADSVAISHDGKTVYFDRSSLSAPNDIYAIGIEPTTS